MQSSFRLYYLLRRVVFVYFIYWYLMYFYIFLLFDNDCFCNVISHCDIKSWHYWNKRDVQLDTRLSSLWFVARGHRAISHIIFMHTCIISWPTLVLPFCQFIYLSCIMSGLRTTRDAKGRTKLPYSTILPYHSITSLYKKVPYTLLVRYNIYDVAAHRLEKWHAGKDFHKL